MTRDLFYKRDPFNIWLPRTREVSRDQVRRESASLCQRPTRQNPPSVSSLLLFSQQSKLLISGKSLISLYLQYLLLYLTNSVQD
ncbi:hypothetical protein L1887_02475 [Cichorium endivia]|nr:hypothetical protein L1887_02475 [Cichorium endivia]